MPKCPRPFVVVLLLASLPAQAPLFDWKCSAHVPSPDPAQYRLGDVDGDGHLDLIGPTESWLQNGSAQFRRGSAAPWALIAEPVAVFDAEGDGDADVLALPLAPGSTSATFYRNTGGTFAAVPGFVPAGMFGGQPMDWNGDGLVDVLQPTPLRAFEQHAGGFVDVTATLLPVLAQPTHVAFADLDGDGDFDVVATTPGVATTAVVLRNDGAAGFADVTALALGGRQVPFHTSLAVGDIDGNGRDDVLFENGNGPADQWLTTNVGQLVPSGAQLPGGDGALYANVDGVPGAEYIVRDPVAGITRLLTVRGGALVNNTATLGLGEAMLPRAAADLDGNGRVDLVLTGARRTAILLQGSDGRFVDTTLDTGGPLVADLDGDGLADAVAGIASPTIAVLWSTPTEPFAVRAPLANAAQPLAEGLADIDGDGDLDLVVTASAGPAFVLRNDGNRQFTTIGGLPTTTPYAAVFAVDLDRDGDQDLHVVPLLAGNDVILANQNGTFVDVTSQWLPTGWRSALNATNPYRIAAPHWRDLDGDGDPDLAVAIRDATGLHLRIVANTGTQLVDATAITMPGVAPGHLLVDFDVADFDGDGLPDLAVMGDLLLGAGYQLAWVHNHGAGFGHTAVQPPYVTAAPTPITVADFDGDGRPDIAVDGQPFVFANLLPTSFNPDPALPIAPAPLSTIGAPFDIDGDGDLDLVQDGRHLSGMQRQLVAPRIACLGVAQDIALHHRATGGARLGFLGYSFALLPAPLRVGLGSPVWLDPAQMAVLAQPIGPADSAVTFHVAVPNAPHLLGADVFVQGAVVAAAGEITNAAVVRLR